MKIRSLIIALLLVSGLMAMAQTKVKENPSMLLESQSRFGFTETNEILSKTILEKGWKITVTHDLQETMKKNGKEVLPVKVIEICNPGLAFRILSKDELRDVSSMLPCRLSVYEKSDGLTYISRMNAPVFAGMIDEEAAKTIILAFDEAEQFIKAVAK
jgi:uncharacterized protein (DUF302 family)